MPWILRRALVAVPHPCVFRRRPNHTAGSPHSGGHGANPVSRIARPFVFVNANREGRSRFVVKGTRRRKTGFFTNRFRGFHKSEH